MTDYLHRKVASLLSGLLFSIMMPAQTLPPLPDNPQVRQGRLKCGISYYLINNPVEKGYADIAIVRTETTPEATGREMLDSLAGFSRIVPYEFLSGLGIGPGKKGYMSREGPATVFRFDRVPLYNEAAADSVLLLTFAMMAQSLMDEAIMVSGDIKVQEVVDKMEIFSMMLPPREGADAGELPQVTAPAMEEPSGCDAITTVRAVYTVPRPEKASLRTAQTPVMENFASEMEETFKRRMERLLPREGIPSAGSGYQYVGALCTDGDERHIFSISTDQEHAEKAAQVLGATLRQLGTDGLSIEEFQDTKAALSGAMLALERQKYFPNSAYINQFISAYLYGGDLAPLSTRVSYFMRRALPDSSELRLLNDLASAILGEQRLIEPEGSGVAEAFDRGYDTPTDTYPPYVRSRGDTLTLNESKLKVKLKKTVRETVSGGEQWISSNGMSVVFRHLPGSGTFSYALLLKGGMNSVPGLRPGEATFIPELLGLYDVAGLKSRDFEGMLRANGISLSASLSVSGLSLHGSAPSSSIGLLLKSLLSLSNDRALNTRTVEDYFSDQRLRLLSADSTEAAMYRILYPDFAYSPYKDARNLDDSLVEKADRYFKERFGRVNDGVLVICGDLGSESLKKLLSKYLGGFMTDSSQALKRTASYRPRSGWSTYTVDGREPGLHMMLSTELPLTVKNELSARIVERLLRKIFIQHLTPYGMAVRVKATFDTAPEERLRVSVDCSPADTCGLPASIADPDVLIAVAGLRRALAAASSEMVDAMELAALKALALEDKERELSSQEGIVRAAVTRFSEGKDLTANYKGQAAAINPESLGVILKSLASSSRVEYIVR